MSQFWESIVTVFAFAAIVAGIAVIVSRKSQSPAVIQSVASGYGNILDVAISPVTGTTSAPQLSYPGSIGGGALDLGGTNFLGY